MTGSYELQGYHRLARAMSRSSELTMFRKFDDLNILSLMSMQGELVQLRDEFYSICEDDEKAGLNFSSCFAGLLESNTSANNFQHEKLLMIREKLGIYNEKLLQYARVHQLSRPSDPNIDCLEEWLRDSKGGNCKLYEDKMFAWNSDVRPDLLSFHASPPDQDPFTRWIKTWPVTCYHRLWGHKHKRTGGRVIDEETGLVDYQEGRLSRATAIVSTIVASTMPMLAILGLYFEQTLLKRIYIAIGISAAFSTVLVVFTTARRIEIFMATAALAAVEVVFIGSAEKKG